MKSWKLDASAREFLSSLAEKEELNEEDGSRLMALASGREDGSLVQRYTKALQEARDEAQRANQTRTEFLTRMSHDIRTPLNGITGMLEIAEKNSHDSTKMQECFEKIRSSVSELLLMVNDILNMHELESGKIELASEKFELTGLIMDCTQTLLPLARAYNIHLKVKCAPGLRHTRLIGSPSFLRRIYNSLVTNAIKYNKPNGRVDVLLEELSSDARKAQFRITVRDTGIGISEEFLRHIFEPFSQETKDSRTTYRGSGLGLSICRKLAEMMDGKIEAESCHGRGSIFIVTLPIEIDLNPSDIRSGYFGEDFPDLTGVNVLLVEDNELNAEIAGFMLQEMDATVIRAENGQMAIDEFRNSAEGEIQLILMDVMMPVKNGLEATEEIRAMDREDAKTVPIIAMTANALADDVRRCLAAGMNAHMAKPFDSMILRHKILPWLKTDDGKTKERDGEIHVEQRGSLRYGLTETERKAGLQEYNHPLFMSQAVFTDACWEVHARRAAAVVLQDYYHPELTGRMVGYEKLLESFAGNSIGKEEHPLWLEKMSLEALRNLREEELFELQVKGKDGNPEWFEVVLVPAFDAAGNTERIYMTARRRRKQADIKPKNNVFL